MILTQDNEFSAVLHTSALLKMQTCELLMRCCEEPALFRILWAQEVLSELGNQLVDIGYSKQQSDLRLQKMKEAFPEALVSIPSLLLHSCSEVTSISAKCSLALAIRENANVIVSWDTEAFPKPLAEELDIYIQSPDEFLVNQAHLNRDRMQDALDAQADAHRVPRAVLLERLSEDLPLFRVAMDEF